MRAARRVTWSMVAPQCRLVSSLAFCKTHCSCWALAQKRCSLQPQCLPVFRRLRPALPEAKAGVRLQGWRRTMEDAHIAAVDLGDSPDAAMFGVFDGHGGRCGSGGARQLRMGLLWGISSLLWLAVSTQPSTRTYLVLPWCTLCVMVSPLHVWVIEAVTCWP